ncbi:MAG: Gfo/Idh/MocA family oxidoreductase [Chloroflexia bacterium]|nr:Gfo/Idh/MocA family oxidoreductase [Chloroflexia bacterium]
MVSSGVRAAVIGCGAQGRNHLQAYAKHPDVEIVAICDTDPKRLAQTALDFSVPATFPDYRWLLDAVPCDLISICTMPVSHAEMAIAALQRGANVLCEKPLAMNLDEALAMTAAAKQAERFLTVGFNMRHLPAAQTLRKMVADGEIGLPVSCRAWTLATDIPWWGKHYVKRISGGGVLASTAVHILDLALWVAGNPQPVTASASMDRVFPRKRASTAPTPEALAEFDVEDTFSGHIRFADGGWMDLSGGWGCDQPEYSYSFELVGDKATVQLAPLRIVAERNGVPVDVTPSSAPVDPTGMHGWPASVAAEIADAVDAVRNERSPLVRIDEALTVQAIVDALYRSAETRQEVPVTLPTLS